MTCKSSIAAALVVVGLGFPSHADAQLHSQPYVTGVSNPVAFVPDPTAPSRQFVVEQTGRIRVVVGGALQPVDFLDLSGVVSPPATGEGERGLLGLVFAPDYATSGRFFVSFTRLGGTADERGDVVIARFTRSSDPAVADPNSRFDLRWGGTTAFIEHTASPYHNGGCMAFGPDGYLYISLGDGADGDPDNNAQNPMDLRGKILRIDINVSDSDAQGYRVPDDNPFLDGVPVAALPEIWSFGFRNPWRFSFDDPALGGSGAMLIGDVGQTMWEELNFEPAGSGGRNYGWRIVEGTHAFVNPNVENYEPPPAGFLPLTDPIYEYGHDVGRSITGGYVYRGAGLGATMRGRYIFGDFVRARLWSAAITPNGDSAIFSDLVEHTAEAAPGRMSSFAVDATGELYIVTYGGAGQGVISRLCGVSLGATSLSFTSAGGSGDVHVTSPAECAWSVSESTPWISIQPGGPSSGSGVVTLVIAAYGGSADRQATVTIGGQTVTIVQAGNPTIPGDVDHSGTADVLWQHTDGRIALWRMNGLTLGSGEPFGPAQAPADANWRLAAVADFNGDGNTDAVLQHATDGRLVIWLMTGTTVTAAIPLGQVADTNWKIRAATDMNQDGWPDLVWQRQANGLVSVWLMQGTALIDGLLLTSVPTLPDNGWQIVAATDMNGDGSSDLVWQHASSGALSAWLMNGTSYVDGVWLSPSQVADTNWKIRGVGDFNLDGRSDLLWYHQTQGLVSVWLMNGLTIIDGIVLTPGVVADLNWKVAGPK